MPVLGHAAEAGHYPVVEIFEQCLGVAHGGGGVEPERFDLQPVDRHHAVAVIHQMVRQGEAGGTKTDDQHFASAVRARAADGAISSGFHRVSRL